MLVLEKYLTLRAMSNEILNFSTLIDQQFDYNDDTSGGFFSFLFKFFNWVNFPVFDNLSEDITIPCAFIFLPGLPNT